MAFPVAVWQPRKTWKRIVPYRDEHPVICEAYSYLFAWLISHQPTVLFSQKKSAISNQPTVLFSQNKSALAIRHQPNEQPQLLAFG
jgi:hypothetical protein